MVHYYRLTPFWLQTDGMMSLHCIMAGLFVLAEIVHCLYYNFVPLSVYSDCPQWGHIQRPKSDTNDFMCHYYFPSGQRFCVIEKFFNKTIILCIMVRTIVRNVHNVYLHSFIIKVNFFVSFLFISFF